jgi:hypothetical protein
VQHLKGRTALIVERNDFAVDTIASGVIVAAASISFVSVLLLNGAPPLQPRERAMLANYEQVRVSLAGTGSSLAASVTICLRKPRRPSPKL